ncbi:MAG: alanine dehydrogenase [Candidatus Hecatellales archaeon B24]|nr:MAG: alanine dehydrogenase [Candidatus Hecatellales archaeon B24]
MLGDGEVRALLTMEETIKAVEEAFKEKNLGRVQSPLKSYLFYEKYNGDHRFMPAYIEKLNIAGVKIVNTHPENRRKYGLPTVAGIIVLANPETGAILAILEATWITLAKTAAASAVATKYLARKEADCLGLVGAGLQAVAHLEALNQVMKLGEAKVWSRTRRTAEKFVERMAGQYPDVKLTVAETVREAAEGCDVIATLTPSRKPIVMGEWVKPGIHINAMGADAPGKQELDPSILRKAKIVVDDLEHSSHSGEINVPLSQGLISKENVYGEIGEIALGRKPGRTSSREITVFASTGVAIQDIAVAEAVYRKAVKQGFGLKIDLTGPTLGLI